MISDEYIKQLYLTGQNFLAQHGVSNKPTFSPSRVFHPSQLFRGIVDHNWKDQQPGGCIRHLSVFDKYNIIPKYCFNCYKILIEPRSVVELFKLMVIFDKLKLPNDNTRKCMVEAREQVSGTYKGYIYCRGIEEGEEILKMLNNILSNEISEKIPVTMKRGCSEYSLAYPEYAQIGQGTASMEYKKEWQEYEDLADKELSVNSQHSVSDTNNHPGFNQIDAQVMHAWLIYAATIRDLSYLKISGKFVTPLFGLKRPSTFKPVDEE